MPCSVALKCPYFHFSETLTSKLRFSSKRLLGNKRVGANGAGMHFVFDKGIQLHYVDVAHRHRVVERLARSPVVQADLAAFRKPCLLEFRTYLLFSCGIEPRRHSTVPQRPGSPPQVRFQNL